MICDASIFTGSNNNGDFYYLSYFMNCLWYGSSCKMWNGNAKFCK